MRNYETAVILSASLTEGELEKEIAGVVEIIDRTGGTHTGTQSWGRRMLAFPIKRQTEGVYYFVRWDGTQEVSTALDWSLRINEKCLRHLHIRLDESGGVAEGVTGIEEEHGAASSGADFPDSFDSEEESEQDSEE